MKDLSAVLPMRALHISDEVVQFLCSSTEAGNRMAQVSLKEALCPKCAAPTLAASVRLRCADMVGFVRHRRFEVITHCKVDGCGFVGTTNGKFSLTG